MFQTTVAGGQSRSSSEVGDQLLAAASGKDADGQRAFMFGVACYEYSHGQYLSEKLPRIGAVPRISKDSSEEAHVRKVRRIAQECPWVLPGGQAKTGDFFQGVLMACPWNLRSEFETMRREFGA